MASRRLTTRSITVAVILIAAWIAVMAPGVARAATPTVAVSPTSGSPGTALTVSGSGWTAGDAIFVQIGSTTFGQDVVCSITANLSGQIVGNQTTNSCSVPNVPAGARTLFAVDSSHTGTTATGASFTVAPALTLTPAGSSAGAPASPGASVTIQGHGFAGGTTVSAFKLDGVALTTTPASISTDSQGNFTAPVTFTVPSATTAASHTVSASDGTHTGSATIKIFRPTISVSPTSGSPGTGLTVSGAGWPAHDAVFVQIGSTTFDMDVVCSLTVAPSGAISGDQVSNTCVIPNVPAGGRPLFAIDDQNQGVHATGANFTVAPVLTLTPASSSAGAPASPGTSVTVQGHGFAGGATVSAFKLDGVALTTSPTSISTDAQGNFISPVTFTVPAATTAATHTVSASDGTHTGSAMIRIFRPTITVSPTSATPGSGLTVSGAGWPAHDTIFVQIGSTTFDTDVVCALTALPSGAISGDKVTNSCQVPNVPAGSRSLFAVDDQNQGVHAAGANFTVAPLLTLTPASSSAGAPASPGATVTVQGHGFAAGATVSAFKLDGVALTTTPASMSTDAQGNFISSVTFTVPAATTAASHTVSASDGAHTGSATIRIFRPTISVSPTSGSPGTGLTVSGAGWPAHDTIFVQIGSTTFDTDVVCALTAMPSGAISGDKVSNSCQVPSVPAGSQSLFAIDNQNQSVHVTGASFTISAALTLTPLGSSAGAPASPGATVTVQGHGFAAGATVSGFKLDGVALTTSPTSMSTDAQGNFISTVTFTVPAATTAATHAVSASDGAHTGTGALKVFRPTVSVSPASGPVGTALTVSGSGWPAGDTIFVQIGSTTFDADVVCAITANLNGQISGNKTTNNCQVPSVAVGSQTLFAIDEQNQGVTAKGANFSVTAVRGVRPLASATRTARSRGITRTATTRTATTRTATTRTATTRTAASRTATTRTARTGHRRGRLK